MVKQKKKLKLKWKRTRETYTKGAQAPISYRTSGPGRRYEGKGIAPFGSSELREYEATEYAGKLKDIKQRERPTVDKEDVELLKIVQEIMKEMEGSYPGKLAPKYLKVGKRLITDAGRGRVKDAYFKEVFEEVQTQIGRELTDEEKKKVDELLRKESALGATIYKTPTAKERLPEPIKEDIFESEIDLDKIITKAEEDKAERDKEKLQKTIAQKEQDAVRATGRTTERLRKTLNCVVCDKELTGNQSRFCSTQHRLEYYKKKR